MDGQYQPPAKPQAFVPLNPWEASSQPEEEPHQTPSSSLYNQTPIFNNILASDSHQSLPKLNSSEDLVAKMSSHEALVTARRVSESSTNPTFQSILDPWATTSATSAGTAGNVDNIQKNNLDFYNPPATEQVAARKPDQQQTLQAQATLNLPYLTRHEMVDSIKVDVSTESKTIFGHLKYTVTSSLRGTSVLRRYSDFLWLQDVLLKKYEFRIVTSLPPKKAVGADAVFIERRRRGFIRFLNFVSNHPIFSKDDLFIVFMTSEMTIQEFKSKTPYMLDEEFLVAQLTDSIVNAVPPSFDDHLVSLKRNIRGHLDLICEILKLYEAFIAKLHDSSSTFMKFGALLALASRKTYCMIPDCIECTRFETDIDEIKDGISDLSQCIQNQAHQSSFEILEKLKSYRDALAGFQLLLQRRELALPGLSLVPIERRIAIHKSRLDDLNVKGGSLKDKEKIESTINQDEREIEYLTAKAKFMRYCLWNEFALLHARRQLFKEYLEAGIQSQIMHTSEHLKIWSMLVSIFDN